MLYHFPPRCRRSLPESMNDLIRTTRVLMSYVRIVGNSVLEYTLLTSAQAIKPVICVYWELRCGWEKRGYGSRRELFKLN